MSSPAPGGEPTAPRPEWLNVGSTHVNPRPPIHEQAFRPLYSLRTWLKVCGVAGEASVNPGTPAM
jgi:hypothetical protein